MGWFSRKKDQERFKHTLTYGEDIVALYEEAKRLDREVTIWRDRIWASEEHKIKEQLENERREYEKRYEKLLGEKYGFNTDEMGTYFHLRDYMKDYNKCDRSPFGYHGVVRRSDANHPDYALNDMCIFCNKDSV
jgi:hypothetical protein